MPLPLPLHLRPRFLPAGSGALLALLLSLPAEAAPPGAGQLLQDVQPAPPATVTPASPLPETGPAVAPVAAGGVAVMVQDIRISGATVYAAATLQTLLDDARGKSLDLAGLRGLAQRITDYYHAHGYLLARAYLPPQDISTGSVEIRVLEGRLDRLRVQNSSLLTDAAIARQLHQLPEGQALRAQPLERDLLLLSELPGVVVHSTLRPGEAAGGTDMDLLATPGPRVSGNVVYDNDGNPYTGLNRIGGSLRIASPTGQGDSLSLQTQYARGLEYGHVAYQIPVGYFGTQVGPNASWLGYHLAGKFASLNAHGAARDVGLQAWQPLWRSRILRLDLQASVAHRLVNDIAQGLSNPESFDVAYIGLSAQGHDALLGGGASTASLTLTQGHLTLKDEAAAQGDRLGHQTAGRYRKLQAQAGREQALGGRFVLSLSLSAQHAAKNLDGAEEMEAGGASGVRAYGGDEAPFDSCLLTRIELRRALGNDWQAGVFVDGARGFLHKHALPGDADANGRNLAGEGLAIYWNHRALSLQGFVAWRSGDVPTDDPSVRARLGAQASLGF